MATFVFTLQGSTPTTIDAGDYIQFAGATFGSAITVGSYNDSTHVESSVGANDSSANTPNNVKFISQTGGTAGDSQADWGDGTEDIDAITNAEATLKLNFAHGSAVVVTGWKIYAYDGTTPATAPSNIDVRMAEVGEIIFTEAEGSGAPVNLADGSSNTTFDRYVLISCSPATVGLKTAFAFRTELTYT
jgi:hypothetical protein